MITIRNTIKGSTSLAESVRRAAGRHLVDGNAIRRLSLWLERDPRGLDAKLTPFGRVSYKSRGKREIVQFGRFIRRQVPKSISDRITDRELAELAYCVSGYSSGVKIAVVSGSELEDAFRYKVGGQSCMTGSDRSYCIQLYVKNPKVVSLVIASTAISTARALLWKTDQGVTVMDRIYPNDGSVAAFNSHAPLGEWADRQGIVRRYHSGAPYSPFRSGRRYTVTVKPDPDGYWPFLDTFCFGHQLPDGKWRLEMLRSARSTRIFNQIDGSGEVIQPWFQCPLCDKKTDFIAIVGSGNLRGCKSCSDKVFCHYCHKPVSEKEIRSFRDGCKWAVCDVCIRARSGPSSYDVVHDPGYCHCEQCKKAKKRGWHISRKNWVYGRDRWQNDGYKGKVFDY